MFPLRHHSWGRVCRKTQALILGPVWFWLQARHDSSVGKESACNAGDSSLIPGWGNFNGEGIGYHLQYSWASLVTQLVKNPPAMWETWVQSLGWEDSLEKGKASHSSLLAWRIPWTSPWGPKELDTTERLSFSLLLPTVYKRRLELLSGHRENKLSCRRARQMDWIWSLFPRKFSGRNKRKWKC